MNTTTAETLHRQLVLPVRAVRAGLGAAADQDPVVVARHTAKVVPALAKAADQVAALQAKVERVAAKNERKIQSPAKRRHRGKALADALAAVGGVHEDLNAAIRSLGH
jgi:hypothetical protein